MLRAGNDTIGGYLDSFLDGDVLADRLAV